METGTNICVQNNIRGIFGNYLGIIFHISQ